MGGNVDTGTQTSGLTNPAMQQAATTIGNQLNTQLKAGVKPYTGSMVPALSGATSQGIAGLTGSSANAGGINAANQWATGVIGSGGYNPALTQAQSGINTYLAENAADAPGFEALKDRVATGVNATMQGSGRFGSMSHANDLASGLAGVEYQNYADRLARSMAGNQALAGIGQTAMGNAAGAAGMAPSLFSASLMPAQAALQAGQIQDAWNAASAEDKARIFDVTNNAGWNTLQRGSSIFAGTAPVSGTQTTQSKPWWQVGLGLGSTALGML